MDRVNTRRRLLVVLSAGVLFALSAVLGTVSLAKPGQRDSDRLTPQQRAEFVAGAQEVAGLTDVQIAAALKNPDAVAAIPVSFGVVDNSSPAPSFQGERSRSAAAAACAAVSGEANYRNIRGELLARFATYREFCYNGFAITYLTPLQVGGGVTRLGASRGWRYQGVVYSKGGYFPYKGRPQGGHKAVRTASFKACPEGMNCFRTLPKIGLYVHYDGFRYPRIVE
jgi:hypothetical protein